MKSAKARVEAGAQPATVAEGSWETASTRIESARASLIPRRALHTWQMKFGPQDTSRMFCCSRNPSSRSRSVTAGGLECCLMHTTVPAWMLLKGQVLPPAQWPSKITYGDVVFLTGIHIIVIETWLQQGIGFCGHQ